MPDEIDVVPASLLEELAAEVPQQPSKSRKKSSSTSKCEFDVEQWITDYGLVVDGPYSWDQGGRRWVFGVCPWNSEHDNRSAYIVEMPNGALAAGCHHNGCKDKRWADLRALYQPGYSERETNSVTTVTAQRPTDWKTPDPIPNELRPVPIFPNRFCPIRFGHGLPILQNEPSVPWITPASARWSLCALLLADDVVSVPRNRMIGRAHPTRGVPSLANRVHSKRHHSKRRCVRFSTWPTKPIRSTVKPCSPIALTRWLRKPG